MKKTNQSTRWGVLTCLQLVLLLAILLPAKAQQRTWMLPYFFNGGGAVGVDRVPIINFKNNPPTFETRYINNSFSTQAVGNGEYCNNCAMDQVTRLSEFFISGRAANSFQGNNNGTNQLKTLYAKWEQICGDTARVDTFLTAAHLDLAHESLNEIAVGDGENPGTFWVVMQQSPVNGSGIGIDGFGPGFYVILMDMNNSNMNTNLTLQINNANFPLIPSGNNLGEGVALGPKFQYIMQPGETNAALIALNGRNCRSVYIASDATIYHLLINLSNNTLVYSDSQPISGGGSGNMFMEMDLNYPQNGRHPTQIGLTGWGGVLIYNLSPDHGKVQATVQPRITTAAGGYGLEFDKNGTNLFYSLHGSGVAAGLRRVATTVVNFTTTITPAAVTVTPALGTNPNNTNNYLALESALDGNIYGITGAQEFVTIVDPELSPNTATSYTFNAGVFQNPSTHNYDLNPTNNSSFLFGVSLPDWVDGEVPLSSTGGTIEVKIPCELCNEAHVKHSIDIYAGTPGNETLVQHYDLFPCESQEIKVCPGVDYHVIYDEGLPGEQDDWVSVSFPGDYHLLTYYVSGNSNPYIQYNSNTTITSNTLWDNKVYIGPGVIVTVTNGATLDITNVDVIFGRDAGIDFKDGAIIRANNSVFRPCDMNDVWRSVAFWSSNGTMPSGLINECTFKNAKTAIEGLGSTTPNLKTLDLRITNNLFADCQRGIGLNLVDFKRSITGNTYMLENKFLPFKYITTAPNPPKTYAPTTNDEFYGIYSLTGTFHDMIAQNDFVMVSDSTKGDTMSYAIYLVNFTGAQPSNTSTPTIASNKITDFSYGIATSGINKLSIENNSLEWTNLYRKVIPNQYKFHIYVNYGDNVLIKGNKIYSANLLNLNPGSNAYDNGAGSGPNTPQYKSVGITANFCNYVVMKQNEITGVESGIVAIGQKLSGVVNKNVFISENEIKKSWYYGIYLRSYNNTDIACNTIDMELKTGKDATGIGYFNMNTAGGYANPANVAFRTNCILNTKNAIYCYNPAAAGASSVPRIYNNFCYNYTRVGFENNGFAAVNGASPYDIHRNTFVSNNSSSLLPDLLCNAGNPLTGDFNWGIQNFGANVTLFNGNAGNSTASCGMQTSTNANSLNSLQTCEYFYPTQASWNPNGKLAEWPYEAHDHSVVTEPFELSNPLYTDMGEIISTQQSVFDMFPVPAAGNVSITYNLEKAENAYIEFIDIQGRVLKTVALEADHTTVDVNISEFTPGVYIVRLTNSDKGVYYSKLVKQ
jgi:hypothetical protein